ncbi:MAG: hypothetical protein QF795_04810 [Candidatus Marinimicrobia bacterium]|jgi:hypothetical protein|nr:hypothetical protein [Candidatus Neomarinimicrobiota bacterium]MDP7609153.1 hypothetical protein [Candidatus Neomarinimicrobiota bacterium]|tara:strand:- start:944 stop:1609 length:666 start_codon:yes stop_codon:yes gene_type:complete
MHLSKLIISVILGTVIFAQEFDPETGELIEEKQYDPLTGELIETDKETVEKTVIIYLKSGDSITGIIESETDTEVTLLNNTLGRLTLDKKVNIRSIQPFSDVSVSNFSSTGVKVNESKPTYSSVVAHAEQQENNVCHQAELDAVASTSPLWYGGGIIYYVGVPAYFLSKPQPNHYAISNIAPEKQRLYMECYKTAAQNERGKRMAIGCGGTLLFIMMLSSM